MTKIFPRVPPVYRLRDYADDEIEDVFYVEVLQKVHKTDDIYKMYLFIVDKCCKEDMNSEVFSKVLLQLSCRY